MAQKLMSGNNSRRSTFEEPDNNSEQCDDASLRELCPLIQELITLPETFNRPLPSIQYPEGIHAEHVREQLLQQAEALNDGRDRTCTNCSKARRVENMHSLQRGQHISIPGQHSNVYSKPLAKQKSAYRHHAIIKSIVCSTNYTAEVNLIHFSEDNGVMKVCEQARKFNLQYDEIYIIDYQYPRHNPDAIVQNAESVTQNTNINLFKDYNLCLKNCEHFATWCVLGEQVSSQTNTLFGALKQMVWNIWGASSNIANWILRIFGNSADELASCFTNSIYTPLAVLGGCSSVYLIYCIIKTYYLIKQYRNEKTICWHCLKEKLLDMWLQFGIFGVTSAITFVIVNFALPLLAPHMEIAIGSVLVLLANALTLSVPKIRKALCSPVQYREKEIKTLLELKPGDVASLSYWKFSHLVVVSDVKWDNDPKKGTLRGIHYSLPGLLSTREIAEDTFQVDLEKSKVNLVQFNTFNTFSPQEAVDRARKRVGEKKWNMFSNISDHLCQWAKVKSDYNYFDESESFENEESRNTPSGNLSTFSMGKVDVHLMNEIEPGDVVEYRSKMGIVVKLEDVNNGRKFHMHVVHCHKGRGGQVSYEIDLNQHYLVNHKYHPVHCVSKEMRVRKALGMINRTINSWTQNGFIKDIIKRHSRNN